MLRPPDKGSAAVQRVSSYRLCEIAVRGARLIPGAGKVLADLVGDRHRAMMSACAAESDGQIALALVDVMGQQVSQQFRDAGDEFGGLRKGTDVTRDSRILARQLFEFGDVVRVGQKTNVKNQVAVGWHSVAESEARNVNENTGFVAVAGEFLFDEVAEFMDIEPGSLDDKVGKRAHGGEQGALLLDALADRLFAGAQGMRPARFAEPPHDGFVGGFQEYEAYVETA